MATKIQKPKLSHLGRAIYDLYQHDSKGSEAYLTDRVRRALIAQAAIDVIYARYEVEAERTQHTSPNVYADACWEVEAFVGLRPQPVEG